MEELMYFSVPAVAGLTKTKELRSVQDQVSQARIPKVVMSVLGCGERETIWISRTHLGADWDTRESFLKNGGWQNMLSRLLVRGYLRL